MLAEGIHTLGYGHYAIPTEVVHYAMTGGKDGATLVLTAAEARNSRIPLRKEKYAPACQDPKACFREERRAREATQQDGKVVANVAPAANAATALPSTAPALVDAPPPEVLFEYMWDDAI